MTRPTTPDLLTLLQSGQWPVDTPLSRADILARLRAAGVEFTVHQYRYVDRGGTSHASESLGIPLGTVMSRLHRARREVQGRLQKQARQLGILPAEETASGDEGGPISLEQERLRRQGGQR